MSGPERARTPKRAENGRGPRPAPYRRTRFVHPLGLAVALLTTSATQSAPNPFTSCTSFGCTQIREVTLSAAQWQSVRALFEGMESAAAERQSIRRAIALIETGVGDLTGTHADLPENNWGQSRRGQLDCIAESTNTTTYLNQLQSRNLLQWHEVEDRAVRHLFIFSHWTAVIRDRQSDERYAVDSWFGANGQLPHIQKLDDWKRRRPPPTDPVHLRAGNETTAPNRQDLSIRDP